MAGGLVVSCEFIVQQNILISTQKKNIFIILCIQESGNENMRLSSHDNDSVEQVNVLDKLILKRLLALMSDIKLLKNNHFRNCCGNNSFVTNPQHILGSCRCQCHEFLIELFAVLLF